MTNRSFFVFMVGVVIFLMMGSFAFSQGLIASAKDLHKKGIILAREVDPIYQYF